MIRPTGPTALTAHTDAPQLIPIDITDDGDMEDDCWSSSGLHENMQKRLEALINTGEDFVTEDWDCMWKQTYALCGRQNGRLWVEVEQWRLFREDFILEAMKEVAEDCSEEIDAVIRAASGHTLDTLHELGRVSPEDKDGWENRLVERIDMGVTHRTQVKGEDVAAVIAALNTAFKGTSAKLRRNLRQLTKTVENIMQGQSASWVYNNETACLRCGATALHPVPRPDHPDQKQCRNCDQTYDVRAPRPAPAP